jgi:hypothetical protein
MLVSTTYKSSPNNPQIALWIVGEPGIGKTTLTSRLIDNWGGQKYLSCSPKWTCGKGFAAAGHYRGDVFDGADSVPIQGINPLLASLRLAPRKLTELVVFDGDKFSTAKAVDTCKELHRRCVVILMEGQALAENRRKLRGTSQHPSWVKGRRTKASRFVSLFESHDTLRIDAALEPEKSVLLVASWLYDRGFPSRFVEIWRTYEK